MNPKSKIKNSACINGTLRGKKALTTDNEYAIVSLLKKEVFMVKNYRTSEHTFSGKKRIEIISELTKKFGFRCWYCGYKFENNNEVCIDHIKPLCQSKDSSIGNLALSCVFCNSHKFYFPVELFLSYLARIRTGQFECLILKDFENDISSVQKDILSKNFY